MFTLRDVRICRAFAPGATVLAGRAAGGEHGEQRSISPLSSDRLGFARGRDGVGVAAAGCVRGRERVTERGDSWDFQAGLYIRE